MENGWVRIGSGDFERCRWRVGRKMEDVQQACTWVQNIGSISNFVVLYRGN